MNKHFFPPLVLSLIAASLVGCGDSSSDDGGEQPVTTSISGKAIDGYIEGASVFLDLNNNGKQDGDEPSAVTDNTGSYELDLTDFQQRCLEAVPVKVMVPEGAIDQDSGVVEEPYMMTIAPNSASENGFNNVHITPLTSTAWQGMYSLLAVEHEYSKYNCEQILENQELLEEIRLVFDQALFDMSEAYNLSREQIFSDYIASNDPEAHELAVNMVEGLQRSFRETTELLAKGNDVWMYQYIYTAGSPEYSWYVERGYDWILNYGMNNSTSDGEVQGREGFNEDFTISQTEWQRSVVFSNLAEGESEGIFLKEGTYLRTETNEQGADRLTCELLVNIEDVWESSNRDFFRYERSTQPTEVSTKADCQFEDFDDSLVVREFVARDQNDQMTSMDYHIGTNGLSSLMQYDIKEYSHIKTEIDSWNISWTQEDSFSPMPTWMQKSLVEYSDGKTITTSRDLSGYVKRRVQYPDGTYVDECPESQPTPPEVPSFSQEACGLN
ncbi:hypothetical protein AB4345_16720 [Vibrio breoganii]|uniref:hypothetical protein n=1 Tax=Vibrio breoganii TaxID=553239 RepID=UPI000C84EE8B|nr:hypothetical protein [Vibrio breoganii]PML37322.1 hypothetical protein BCT78_07665 [Vibrio breoganii]